MLKDHIVDGLSYDFMLKLLFIIIIDVFLFILAFLNSVGTLGEHLPFVDILFDQQPFNWD